MRKSFSFVPLALVLGALLACKSKSGKQKDYAETLKLGLPRGCSATVGSYDSLLVNCIPTSAGDDTSAAGVKIIALLKADCAKLKSVGFSSITLNLGVGKGMYETSDVQGGNCEPTPP